MHPMMPVSTYLELKQEGLRLNKPTSFESLEESPFRSSYRNDVPGPLYLALRHAWSKVSSWFAHGHHRPV